MYNIYRKGSCGDSLFCVMSAYIKYTAIEQLHIIFANRTSQLPKRIISRKSLTQAHVLQNQFVHYLNKPFIDRSSLRVLRNKKYLLSCYKPRHILSQK